jgi:hypothetical protein
MIWRILAAGIISVFYFGGFIFLMVQIKKWCKIKNGGHSDTPQFFMFFFVRANSFTKIQPRV